MITSFGFNINPNAPITFTTLPAGYAGNTAASAGNCCDGFGVSEFSVTKSPPALSSIYFEIAGAGSGTIQQLFETGSSARNGMPQWFAAHIQQITDCGEGCNSLWVAGGDDQQRPPVPLPATAWLLGSGLLALVGIGRRRKTAAAA